MEGNKMQPLYKQYENARPVGVHGITNCFALLILDIDDAGEIAIAAFNNPSDDGYWNIRRHKIHFSSSGRAYIRKGGSRYYFNQIMKTNGGY
jgi:hypothetical protein